MGPNSIHTFSPKFADFDWGPFFREHERPYACKQCANALFYSPPLNAKECIQTLLRASYPHAAEHYSTKNFVVRPAARSKITLERGRTLASNAELVFYSPLLNARELNRHIWQAGYRHGPEQYSHIFPQIRRLRFRPYAAFFASTSAHTLASNAELVFLATYF